MVHFIPADRASFCEKYLTLSGINCTFVAGRGTTRVVSNAASMRPDGDRGNSPKGRRSLPDMLMNGFRRIVSCMLSIKEVEYEEESERKCWCTQLHAETIEVMRREALCPGVFATYLSEKCVNVDSGYGVVT